MSEIEPCPFCGSNSITVGYVGQPGMYFHMQCSECGACGPGTPSSSPAGGGLPPTIGERWNRRAPVSTPQQRAQRASVDTLSAIADSIECDGLVRTAAKLREEIAHINAWGSAGSGVTDGWISVNERLPARCEEVFVWPYPSDYCMTAEMWSLEPAPGVKWVHNEYVTGYGNEKVTMHRAPTHWRPIFAAPSPAPQGEQA